MDDQFAEWDKLNRALERSLLTETGYQRYRKARLRKERLAAGKKTSETCARKRAVAKQG